MAVTNPVKLLVKAPVPVPSLVLLLAVVGPLAVFQHIPRAVTADPPSEDMLPPAVAVVIAMADAAVVVRVGASNAVVVNVTSLP